MKIVSGFICSKSDWKRSDVDDWDFTSIELNGNEKFLGHRKIDRTICKIVQLESGQVAAILEK